VAQAQPVQGAGQGAQGHQLARSHVSQRIGEHVDPPKGDAHHRLNQLADSKFDEEESSTGLVCFGPRIRNEPFPAKFTLPRDMPKYTGAVKPKDWLSDYVTAVVTTQDFIKFWGKFFCLVLLEMIEFSQGFKTFESI
jgi:hypothetical protein